MSITMKTDYPLDLKRVVVDEYVIILMIPDPE